jgi:hypothetical protein
VQPGLPDLLASSKSHVVSFEVTILALCFHVFCNKVRYCVIFAGNKPVYCTLLP